MIATLTSPNGTAAAYAYRRRLERVSYPETPEAYAEAGYDPERWKEDGVGFSARIVASITGLEERAEMKARLALYQTPSDQTREDYLRELAWRVPEWNYATEDDDGNVVPVYAPGQTPADGSPANWEAFDLLPYGVGAWLIETVRTIHLPKRKPWASVSTTATPTLTTTESASPRQEP